jgi:hypothetical protein
LPAQDDRSATQEIQERGGLRRAVALVAHETGGEQSANLKQDAALIAEWGAAQHPWTDKTSPLCTTSPPTNSLGLRRTRWM